MKKEKIKCYATQFFLIHLSFFSPLALSFSDKVSKPEKSFITIENTPPPGFEDLNKPQNDLVDVYLYGRFIVSTAAVYTQETLSFLSPQAIIEKIPQLLDKEQTTTLLKQDQAINADKICYERKQKNCGQLRLDKTGIIFNAYKHRVDLFFSKTLLAEQEAKNKFLPDSDADLSFIMPFSISGSKSSNTDAQYSINGNTLVSKGNTHLQSRWNYSKDKGFQASNLFLRQDKKGKESRLGLFDTTGFGQEIISNQLILGGRYASTTRTRTDRSIASGSKLSVLLNSRSRVEIVREGRVLASSTYEAGNQILDTSLLPDGAYEVILRIQGASGQKREEQHFFSKSQRLPPRDQSLYFIEVGNIYSRQTDSALPESSDHWLAKAGYFTRLNDHIGAKTIATTTAYQSIVELGAVYLDPNFEIDASGLFTSTADFGYQLSARTVISDVNLSVSARVLDVDDSLEVDGIDETTFKPINKSSQDFTASISTSLFKGAVGLSYSLRKNQIDFSSSKLETEEYLSARLRYPLISDKKHHLNLVSQVQRSTSQDDAFMGLEYSFSESHWNHSAKYGVRIHDDSSQESKQKNQPIQLRSTWRDRDLSEADIEADIFYDYGVEEDKSTLGANIDYGFSSGKLDASVEYQKSNVPLINDFSRYNFTFNSSLAGDIEQLSLGGKNLQKSAIIVKMKSNNTITEPFDVRINGQRKGYANTNTSTVINVKPYETYEISISPPVGSNYDYTMSSNHTTTYPGNTKTIIIDVSKTYTAYGQVVDINGLPFANAFIKDSDLGEGSDDFGLFQVEIKGSTKALTFVAGEKECSVKLPAYNTKKTIVALGELVCR